MNLSAGNTGGGTNPSITTSGASGSTSNDQFLGAPLRSSARSRSEATEFLLLYQGKGPAQPLRQR